MKPIVVRREKLVVVPVDVLWQIVEAAATLPSWLPLCQRCEVLSGEGLGRKQRMHVAWGQRTVEIDQEVVEYVPNAKLTWKHVEERINGKPAPRISAEARVTVELRSVGGGTIVALSSRNVPASPFGWLMLRLVAARRLGSAFDRALKNLSASAG